MRTDAPAALETMLAEYRAMTARVDLVAAEVSAMTATARSADGTVTATVGPRGELADLSIDPLLAERLDTKALAARIVEASRLASAQWDTLLRTRMRAILPERLRHVVGLDA